MSFKETADEKMIVELESQQATDEKAPLAESCNGALPLAVAYLRGCLDSVILTYDGFIRGL